MFRRGIVEFKLQSDLCLHVIPAFEDNYFYILTQPSTSECVVVDPGDATPIIDFIQARQLRLTHILLTHHHRDHTGGVTRILNETKSARLICSTWMTIPEAWVCTEVLRMHTEDSAYSTQKPMILGVPWSAVDVRGHTLDHIAFVLFDSTQSHVVTDVFVGDSLFGAGCGGLFEGTHEQMLAGLGRLRSLPGQTRAWCAHEYTIKNLRVATQLNEDNPSQKTRLTMLEGVLQTQHLQPHELMTIPLEMAEEFDTNPFLRWDQPSLQKAIDTSGSLETFTHIRKFRDRF